MQWNNEHKMISKRGLADVIGELSTNAVKRQTSAEPPMSPLTRKSTITDDDTLQSEVRNFINEIEKLRLRQDDLENQIAEQEGERQEMVTTLKVQI